MISQQSGDLPKLPPMPKLPPGAPGTDPKKFPQIPPPTGGGGSINYQTGFTADRQSVNTGNVLGRLAKESQYAPKQQSQQASRAIADLQRAQTANDTAHLRRGIEATNAAQGMQDQVTRSELMQSGLSNQAKIYADMAQRETDQVGLASKLQEAIIRNRFALAQGLLEQDMAKPGYRPSQSPTSWT
jgi:hypothetical protein